MSEEVASLILTVPHCKLFCSPSSSPSDRKVESDAENKTEKSHVEETAHPGASNQHDSAPISALIPSLLFSFLGLPRNTNTNNEFDKKKQQESLSGEDGDDDATSWMNEEGGGGHRRIDFTSRNWGHERNASAAEKHSFDPDRGFIGVSGFDRHKHGREHAVGGDGRGHSESLLTCFTDISGGVPSVQHPPSSSDIPSGSLAAWFLFGGSAEVLSATETDEKNGTGAASENFPVGPAIASKGEMKHALWRLQELREWANSQEASW
jgi:hypothetical protein